MQVGGFLFSQTSAVTMTKPGRRLPTSYSIAAILKNRYDVVSLRRRSSDYDEIWEANAELHADDYK